MIQDFFEGPEKKVELVVAHEFPSLRSLGEDRWRQVVRAAHADVISGRSYPEFDAYLLSESSLFVFDDFVTMITCGQTQLVHAVAEILQFVSLDGLAVLIYERKREHFPSEQPSSFLEDARELRRLVPGQAVRLGTAHEHAVQIYHTTRPHHPEPADVTLEVLMHGIDPGRAKAFVRSANGGRAPNDPSDGLADQLGLGSILPGFAVAEHLFDPGGYSLNAAHGGSYFTIHVTPQRVGSYASFETNHDFRADPSGLVAEVLERFRPESFDIVAFVPDPKPLDLEIPGYELRQHVQEPLAGYHVTFQHFFRPTRGPSRATPIVLD